jgi:RimJ/RimL family protein N-acetyltransferase
LPHIKSTLSLTGDHVLLVPLSLDHANDLTEVVKNGELHRLWYTLIPTADGMDDEIKRRLELQKVGNMIPFSIIKKTNEKVVGMTTFMNIDNLNKRVEIGSTWLDKSVQRTVVNTECKLLLLRHAFETMKCICVEFRTHFINHQSRRGIERLGAKLDGVLRSNALMPNGTIRDTAVYSIIHSEWQTVKTNLEWLLKKYD